MGFVRGSQDAPAAVLDAASKVFVSAERQKNRKVRKNSMIAADAHSAAFGELQKGKVRRCMQRKSQAVAQWNGGIGN